MRKFGDGRLYLNKLRARVLRRVRARSRARANWGFLSADPGWAKALAASKSSASAPKILIATSTGSNWPCSSFESLLGVALTLRGAKVSFLLCDGTLPACQECSSSLMSPKRLVQQGPRGLLCASCYRPAAAMIAETGIEAVKYSDFISGDNTHSVQHFEDACREHAAAGALRFYGRGTLPSVDGGGQVEGRYYDAALTTAKVVDRLIVEKNFDCAVFHHGIYVPQGVIGDVLRVRGIRVVNWGVSYRKSTVLFSHVDTYHRTMTKEDPSSWADLEWSRRKEKRLEKYLYSRRAGDNDWISYRSTRPQQIFTFIEKVQLSRKKPVIGLLTNVLWDAQIHFDSAIYESMLDWLWDTIDHFIQRNDIQLVVRIHPAEKSGTVKSNQPVEQEIKSRYGTLPSHIKIVRPDDPVSTYELMEICDTVLVYGTKTALELACLGIHVIVSGDAWCKGKGFTIDPSSREEYLGWLSRLPMRQKLNAQQRDLAKKYAYHFFFRRMIPISGLKAESMLAPFSVKVKTLEELMPGADEGLDVVCGGILAGKDFSYKGGLP